MHKHIVNRSQAICDCLLKELLTILWTYNTKHQTSSPLVGVDIQSWLSSVYSALITTRTVCVLHHKQIHSMFRRACDMHKNVYETCTHQYTRIHKGRSITYVDRHKERAAPTECPNYVPRRWYETSRARARL